MDLAAVMYATGIVAGVLSTVIGVRQVRHLRQLTHDDSLVLRIMSLDLARHWQRR